MLTPALLFVTGQMQNDSISGSPLGIMSRQFDYYKVFIFYLSNSTVAAQGTDSKCNFSHSLVVQLESAHDTMINRVIDIKWTAALSVAQGLNRSVTEVATTSAAGYIFHILKSQHCTVQGQKKKKI